MSIFSGHLFQGAGLSGGLADVPPGARPVSELDAMRSRFPTLPSASSLRSKGASHFVAGKASGGAMSVTFYDSDGEAVVGPTVVHPGGASPVEPSPMKSTTSLPARREGDGLLPGSSDPASPASEPKWLPWLLIGGGVVVAGGIVWGATRKKAPVKRNRRRRRRRTSR